MQRTLFGEEAPDVLDLVGRYFAIGLVIFFL